MGVTKEDITFAIRSFLSRCSIPYQKFPMDLPFLELCYSEATKRGYIAEGSDALKPFIPSGVVITVTSYAHLEDTSVQVWMALYTACGIYCDDKFQRDTNAVAVFCERLMRGQSQEDRALDAFVDLILEIPRHFPRVTANFMISSTLNLVNALLLEDQTKGLKISSFADSYPAFSRTMSGASELYGLAIFPPEVPLGSFIQALPDLMRFIVNVNDIMSFYKEELNGESVNHISLLAVARGCSKSHAFHSLINETVEAHQNIIHILEPEDKKVLDAYLKFASGYVYFHISLDSRYRLDDLSIQTGLPAL